MTCTSNLTKPHFITHRVHLTGTPLRLDAGPTKGTYFMTLLVWCLPFRHQDQRWEKTIRVEAAPCQQKRAPRKCNFLIKGVVVNCSEGDIQHRLQGFFVGISLLGHMNPHSLAAGAFFYPEPYQQWRLPGKSARASTRSCPRDVLWY